MENAKEVYLEREERLNWWIKDYSKAILQTCLYMMPDRAQAEDAVQDTLIKAWRYFGNNKSKRINNERVWLLRIANNTCRDYLREGWRCRVERGFEVENPPPKMLRIEPEDHGIKLMVMELPEKYKLAILLYYFQGLTQQEISELLEISISTVKRRLRNAEAMLREGLVQAET